MKVYVQDEEGEIFTRLQVKGVAMQSLYLKEVTVSEDEIKRIIGKSIVLNRDGKRIDSIMLTRPAKAILNLLK